LGGEKRKVNQRQLLSEVVNKGGSLGGAIERNGRNKEGWGGAVGKTKCERQVKTTGTCQRRESGQKERETFEILTDKGGGGSMDMHTNLTNSGEDQKSCHCVQKKTGEGSTQEWETRKAKAVSQKRTRKQLLKTKDHGENGT